jgi:endonuclease/exonuclease/phosphatase (EEP) superfamily protein YafD
MSLMRTLLTWLVGLILAALVVASALPLLETNVYWVRFLDFPRLQFLVGLVVALLLWVGLRRRFGPGTLLTLAGVAAAGYHVEKLWPYQPLATKAVADRAQCAADRTLRVISVNVQKKNHQTDTLMDLLDRHRPDLLLVMETDDWWDETLSVLDADYAHHAQDIPEDAAYYGMHVFSRFPFEQKQMMYPFDSDAGMFVSRIDHPAEPFTFIGVHPRPPLGFDQPSTMRDATILRAALAAAESETPAILAGDYNAAPWERTARRAMRLAGFVDPREGRGLRITFDANSFWMKWPLDQILWQPGPGLMTFEVLPGIGSDHYPVLAVLCLGADPQARPPDRHPDDMAEAEASFAAARAMGKTE